MIRRWNSRQHSPECRWIAAVSAWKFPLRRFVCGISLRDVVIANRSLIRYRRDVSKDEVPSRSIIVGNVVFDVRNEGT